MRPIILLTTLFAVLCIRGFAAESRKPNIAVIVADDLGYANVLFNPRHPKEVATAHLDVLEKQSVICRQGYASRHVCSLDGLDVLDALLGKPGAKGRGQLLQPSNDGGNLGLRVGEWKGIRVKNRGKSQAAVTVNPPAAIRSPFDLYHLPTDPAERHDVSAKHPDEPKRLKDRMEELVANGRSRRLK